MARIITEIKAGMAASFMADETLAQYYGFDPGASFDAHFSKVSLESILLFIVATAIHAVESLFDVLRRDVNSELASRLIHNRQWYVNLARSFQFGDALNQWGGYDILDESKQVVGYAAVDELQGRLRLKVAKETVDGLGMLEAQELLSFRAYMQQVKDAGVVVDVVSAPGDSLALVIDIFYDPLVLDEFGLLIDGGGEPVRDTIQTFIKNLPFNGEFKVVSLVDALQLTEGVVIPTVLSAESKFAANDWMVIDARVKPHAGYLVISDDDLIINYRPYDVD